MILTIYFSRFWLRCDFIYSCSRFCETSWNGHLMGRGRFSNHTDICRWKGHGPQVDTSAHLPWLLSSSLPLLIDSNSNQSSSVNPCWSSPQHLRSLDKFQFIFLPLLPLLQFVSTLSVWIHPICFRPCGIRSLSSYRLELGTKNSPNNHHTTFLLKTLSRKIFLLSVNLTHTSWNEKSEG